MASSIAQPGKKFKVWDVEVRELPRWAKETITLESRLSKFAEGRHTIEGFGANSGQHLELWEGEAFHENGFLQALDVAYNFHQGLVLRPDDIWLLVTMGLSEHINKEPEKYRHCFVGFEGRVAIEVSRKGLVPGRGAANDWLGEGVFEEFGRKIENFIGKRMYNALVCDFSTTTPLDLAVSQMVLMNATKQYFTYVVMAWCGIPFITLEGTIEDWENIRERLEAFAPLELHDWLEDMRAILDEFVAAKKGDVRREFWQRIYRGEHQDEVYNEKVATTWVSGWVHAFFPYLSCRRSNAVSKHEAAASRKEHGYGVDLAGRTCMECGMGGDGADACGQWWCKRCWRLWDLRRFHRHYADHENMPSGFRTTPFEWKCSPADDPLDCAFIAGFVGCSRSLDGEQQPVIRPELGFCVLNKGRFQRQGRDKAGKGHGQNYESEKSTPSKCLAELLRGHPLVQVEVEIEVEREHAP